MCTVASIITLIVNSYANKKPLINNAALFALKITVFHRMAMKKCIQINQNVCQFEKEQTAL